MENQTNPQNLDPNPNAGSVYDNWIQPINDKLSQLRLENIAFTDSINGLEESSNRHHGKIQGLEFKIKEFEGTIRDLNNFMARKDSIDTEQTERIDYLNSRVKDLGHKYTGTLNVLTELRATAEGNCFSLIELRIAHNYNLQALKMIKSWGFWQRVGFLLCPTINYISIESFGLEQSDDN